jgi:hypothetical protein
MPKKRRKKQRTDQLLSCFVSPKEKALIIKAIPEGESMSSFLRKIIMFQVKMKLQKDFRANQSNHDEIDEVDETNNDSSI